jgi:hypothetical protein
MASVTFTFSIAGVTVVDLNNTLAEEWAYPAMVLDPASLPELVMIPNPETKAEFNRRQIGDMIRQAYRKGKRHSLVIAAEASVPDAPVT